MNKFYLDLNSDDLETSKIFSSFAELIEAFLSTMPVEEEVSEEGFEIMASEIGFEFDEDVLVKCDREPVSEADWNAISEFVSSVFPLSPDDISHGYTSKSCMVYLPEATNASR